MPTWSDPLEERLRRTILASFHRGAVAPGERLPSIRHLAHRLGEDHRAVARAYHALQDEGLVEIRPRSGVYLAPQELVGGDQPVVSETVTWLGDVLYEAWQRGMTPPELARTVARATQSSRVRIACLDSVRDPLTAVASEIDRALDTRVERILIPPEPPPEVWVRTGLPGPPPDLVTTTAYHAAVRAPLQDAGIPVIVARINPEWVRVLRTWARERHLSTVVADERTGPRLRQLLGSDVTFDVLRADELASRRPPGPGAVVYGTTLARPSLRGRWRERSRVPEVQLLHPRTVRELDGVLVRASLAT